MDYTMEGILIDTEFQKSVPIIRRAVRQRSYDSDESGFDPTNSGDDRIDLDLPETRTVKPQSVKPEKVKTSTLKQKSQRQRTEDTDDDVYIK